MLGRLAKWLRLMGHDAPLLTRPPLQIGPDQLLLTRRRSLAGRPRVVFIPHDDLADQLRLVTGLPGLEPRPEKFFSRCLECNEPIDEIGRERAAAVVPDYTLATAPRFTRCPKCGRLFWPGSHGRRAADFLQAAGVWPVNPDQRQGRGRPQAEEQRP